jgi:hypothetical protein
VTRALTIEGIADVVTGVLRLGNRGEPELPEAAIGRGSRERILMGAGERLETDAVALECDRCQCDHE